MKRVERSSFGRRWKRRLLGLGAATAGALGFGGTVACAYGPGYAGTSCTTTDDCRGRFGAGYVCSIPTGSTRGDCVKRTHFDSGLPDLPPPHPDLRRDRSQPDRRADRPAERGKADGGKADRPVLPDTSRGDRSVQQ